MRTATATTTMVAVVEFVTASAMTRTESDNNTIINHSNAHANRINDEKALTFNLKPKERTKEDRKGVSHQYAK